MSWLVLKFWIWLLYSVHSVYSKCVNYSRIFNRFNLKLIALECLWSSVVNYISTFNRFNLKLTVLIVFGHVWSIIAAYSTDSTYNWQRWLVMVRFTLNRTVIISYWIDRTEWLSVVNLAHPWGLKGVSTFAVQNILFCEQKSLVTRLLCSSNF